MKKLRDASQAGFSSSLGESLLSEPRRSPARGIPLTRITCVHTHGCKSAAITLRQARGHVDPLALRKARSRLHRSLPELRWKFDRLERKL